jgi:PAS domain-containing protein
VHFAWPVAAEIATVVAGGATILGAIPRVREIFGPAVAGAWRILQRLDPNREMKQTVKWIASELRPNGGGSMRDKVDLNSGNIAAMVSTIEAVNNQLNAVIFTQSKHGARLSMLLDESEELGWLSDLEGKQIWASRALVEASGRPASELMGMGWLNTIHGEDQERIRKAWQTCIVEGRNFEADCRFVRPGLPGALRDIVTHGRLYGWPYVVDEKAVLWRGRAVIAPETP